MKFIYYILLFIIYFDIFADCKGGRGSRFRGSSIGVGGGHYRTNSRDSSSDAVLTVFDYIYLTFGAIFVGCFGICLIIVVLSHCIKSCCSRIGETTTSNRNHVSSGIWLYQYYENGNYYGPYQLPLIFSFPNMIIKGTGSDNTGKFDIIGSYSDKTERMVLIQKYQRTGLRIIRLIWNEINNQFEGTWNIKSCQYIDNRQFKLQFIPGSIASHDYNNLFNINSIYSQLLNTYITYKLYSDLLSIINNQIRKINLYKKFLKILKIILLTMIILLFLILLTIILRIKIDHFGTNLMSSLYISTIIPFCIILSMACCFRSKIDITRKNLQLAVKKFTNEQINSQTIYQHSEWSIEYFNENETILCIKPCSSNQQTIRNPTETATIVSIS
ncbi:unnamed protein product [Adineta steineri]|uniref:Uncharacterized protein n=1 Tax=Adineta steineri TaxID=433720 RepID=A0A815S5H7_9BILA|nr:unnamed protein product [Adineta steineri]CAF1485700.1 unnamed protein product [Adineta steineri]